MQLLTFTPSGIYCPAADVYIDPVKPVNKALLTHGHSDHARSGSEQYLCTHASRPVIQYRLGTKASINSLGFGEQVNIRGVKFSFHPAGHIPGSAQIRVENKGEIWVVSGDYKTENDGLSEPFEVVPCHTFITESTFGLPVFRWESQQKTMDEINQWWQKNALEGKVSILAVYALGKAQRVLQNLNTEIGAIYTHGAIENINEIFRQQGYTLPHTTYYDASIHRKEMPAAMVLAAPSAINSSWSRFMKPSSWGMVSGWMTMRGTRRRRAVDRGFVLSDHADWAGLNTAIKATGAENILVNHGYTAIFAKWLRHQGYNALDVNANYEDVQDDFG